MNRTILLLILISVSISGFAQTKTDGWERFAKTKFDAKYNEKAAEYFLFPTFPADLKADV
ncbi:MAG: hypothetical protein U5K54_26740 [Cytophagales bacterium]|nr:hypothetical protein [Cytophagales bacterium]